MTYAKIIKFDFLLPLAVIALGYFASPGFSGIILNYDEGINLVKSALVNEGFRLYSDIWSDQGPVFTWILALVLKPGADPVNSARALVSVFSAVLVLSTYYNVKKFSGVLSGLAAAVFLMLSTRYLLLTNAVMIGLPSLALASLGITLLIYSRDNKLMLMLAGAVFTLGVETKLLTAMVAPAYLVALGENKGRAFIFSAVGSLIVLVLTFLSIGTLSLEQLIGTHVTMREKGDTPGLTRLVELTELDLDYLFLAVFGVLSSSRKQIVYVAWFVVAVTALSFHNPIWTHHYLYFSLPLCALAGGAFGTLRELSLKTPPGAFLAIGLVVGICFSLYRLPQKYSRVKEVLPQIGTRIDSEILTRLNSSEGYIVTDLPFYAVKTGLLVPPKIAVATAKRKRAGMISDETFKEAVLEYQPELVLFGRFKTPKKNLPGFLFEQGYKLEYQGGGNFLYRRVLPSDS